MEVDKAMEKYSISKYTIFGNNLPQPGPDFNELAEKLADSKKVSKQLILDKLYHLATFSTNYVMPIYVKTYRKHMSIKFVNGHIWAKHQEKGPQPAKVMIIGKHPGVEEIKENRLFCGQSGQYLRQSLLDCGFLIEEINNWYVTNVIKHEPVGFSITKSVPTSLIKNCLPILYKEIRIVKPDYILCLGREAIKALFPKGNIKVSDCQGKFYIFQIPYIDDDGQEKLHQCKVVGSIHPANVLRTPDMAPAFISSIKYFKSLMENKIIDLNKLNVTIIDNLEKMKQVCNKLAKIDKNEFAFDAEWHGYSPVEPNSYIRSIQFTNSITDAYIIKLRDENGNKVFSDNDENLVIEELYQLLKIKEQNIRIIGHNFKADLVFLCHKYPKLGRLLVKLFEAPVDDPPNKPGALLGWQKTCYYGGFDTMLAAHSVSETFGQSYKLEILCNYYCQMPRWDLFLKKWIEEEKTRLKKIKAQSEKQLKKKQKDINENNVNLTQTEDLLESYEFEGFGNCPDKLLFGCLEENIPSYAGWDVAGCLMLYKFLNKPGGLLDKDKNKQNSRKAFWISMRANLACLEMEFNGMLVNFDVANDLIDVYNNFYNKLVNDLRKLINWPDFNPASYMQVTQLIFGRKYSQKYDENGNKISCVPDHVETLDLEPIVTSSKPKKPWTKVVENGEEELYSPCTDKETLGILITLLSHNKNVTNKQYKLAVLEYLRKIRFLKSILDRVLFVK